MLSSSILTPNNRKKLRHVENQASWNASLLDFLKGLVDIFEHTSLVDYVRFACCMQFKHLSEIQPRANNRADDIDPIQLFAQRLPLGETVFASSTDIAEPRNGHTISLLHFGHFRPDPGNLSDSFIAGNKG
jgi:hypothetical protein